MKQVSVFHGLVFIVSFLLVLMLLRAGYCNENIKAWEKKIEALNKRAETTTDMAELMKIMVELQGLMQQMPRPGMSPGSDSFSRGNTPEEEVTRRIEAINLAYRDLTGDLQPCFLK